MTIAFSLKLLAPALITTTLFAQSTDRISVNSQGQQANLQASGGFLSADGRFVAFSSAADNLVAGDTNGTQDTFVRELASGITTRVSVSTQGQQGNGISGRHALSADGRFVVFSSSADNLVPGDLNGEIDIFVHDRQTQETVRVSVNSLGQEGDGESYDADISADGRYICFTTYASNLVPGISARQGEICVHDRLTGLTTLASANPAGAQANSHSYDSSISADGRFVCFVSLASDLISGDTNVQFDVFVRDRLNHLTERVSVSSSGGQSFFEPCDFPTISDDGYSVVFRSRSGGLVTGDTNQDPDIFVHDRRSSKTSRVSVQSNGGQANGWSSWSAISSDGRFIAFASEAANLVPQDNNGETDIFLHDNLTGETIRLSIDSAGVEANELSYFNSISADGRKISFTSEASNLVPGDTNNVNDVFVRDTGIGSNLNSIVLVGPFEAPVGAPVQLSWAAAPAHSPYWLAYSRLNTGSVAYGHEIELGSPLEVISSGTISGAGTGSLQTAPIPTAAAGLTVYFEMGVRRASGRTFDSIVQAITFF